MGRFNFEGWSIKEWIYGNKELLKVVIPAIIAFAVTHQWIDATIAGIIGKPILDVLEYFVKK
jgi:hypothetical protein